MNRSSLYPIWYSLSVTDDVFTLSIRGGSPLVAHTYRCVELFGKFRIVQSLLISS